MLSFFSAEFSTLGILLALSRNLLIGVSNLSAQQKALQCSWAAEDGISQLTCQKKTTENNSAII
jgi:hypothetical protein